MSLERRTFWAWMLAMPLGFVLTAAGGLGMAPLAALTALLAFPVGAAWSAARRAVPPLVLSALALAWICVSLAWSPYDRPDQAIKLAVNVPLFALMVFALARLEGRRARLARAAAIFCALASLAYLALEVSTQGWLAMTFKVGVEGHEGTVEGLRPTVQRALSRAATPALIFAGPAALMLWLTGRRGLKGLAVCLGGLALVVAGGFNMHANGLALAAGAFAAGLAFAAPRRALQAILLTAAVAIATGPIVMGAILAVMPEGLADALPLSWAWRLEIWAHALGLIADKPAFGHGLDSARVLEGASTLRGVEIDLLPLHAHNAPLHIWLETGAIGAFACASALAAIALWIGRRTMTAPTAAAAAWALAVWLTNVMVGYGVWQEWHHAALAFGLACAALVPVPRKPGRILA